MMDIEPIDPEPSENTKVIIRTAERMRQEALNMIGIPRDRLIFIGEDAAVGSASFVMAVARRNRESYQDMILVDYKHVNHRDSKNTHIIDSNDHNNYLEMILRAKESAAVPIRFGPIFRPKRLPRKLKKKIKKDIMHRGRT